MSDNYLKKQPKQYGDNGFWQGPEYDSAMANYQRRPQSEWGTPLEVETDIARQRQIPERYADNWYAYSRRNDNPMIVPIDDVEDRTKENGWIRPDLTERNIFGRALENERYGPWEYMPERDRRINESRLQGLYRRMVESMPWR